MDLIETHVVPSLRRNLVSVPVLDTSGYYCSFGNGKDILYQNSNLVGSSSLLRYNNLYLLDTICHSRILGPTRMADPNRVRGARLYTGTH